MSKHEYVINKSSNQSENSFKSFICALLVFLSILIFIFILLQIFNSKKNVIEENKEEIEVIQGYKVVGEESLRIKEYYSSTNRPDTTSIFGGKNQSLYERILQMTTISESEEVSSEVTTKNDEELSTYSNEITEPTNPRNVIFIYSTIENPSTTSDNLEFTTETTDIDVEKSYEYSTVPEITEDVSNAFEYNEYSTKETTSIHADPNEITSTMESEINDSRERTTEYLTTEATIIPTEQNHSIDDTTLANEITVIDQSTSFPSTERNEMPSTSHRPVTETTKFSKSSSKKPSKEKICYSSSCYKTAVQMLSLMDFSAEPCENFYEFSCGRATNEQVLNSFDKYLFEKLENGFNEEREAAFDNYFTFYNSCLDHHRHFNYSQRMEFVYNQLEAIDNINELKETMFTMQTFPFYFKELQISKNKFVLKENVKNSFNYHQKLEDWTILDQNALLCKTKLKHEFNQQSTNLTDLYYQLEECRTKELEKSVLDFVANLKDYLDTKSIDIVKYFSQEDVKKSIALLQNVLRIEMTQITDTNLAIHLKRFQQINETNPLKIIHCLSIYENLVLPKHLKTDINKYCLRITKQLMPEVTNFLYFNQSLIFKNKAFFNFEEIAANISDSLIQNLKHYKTESSLLKYRIISLRKDKQTLKIPSYELLNLGTNYGKNLQILLENFRKNIEKLNFQFVSEDDIFLYFLKPWDTRPVYIKDSSIIAVPESATALQNSLPLYLTHSKTYFNLAKELVKYYYTEIFPPLMIDEEFERLLSDSYNTTKMQTKYDYIRYNNEEFSYSLDNKEDFINQRMIENTAYKLTTNVLNISEDDYNLPWIPWKKREYSNRKIYHIILAQDYCEAVSLENLVYDLYVVKKLPSIVSVDNLLSNSDVFFNDYDCSSGCGMDVAGPRVQFPYSSSDYDY